MQLLAGRDRDRDDVLPELVVDMRGQRLLAGRIERCIGHGWPQAILSGEIFFSSVNGVGLISGSRIVAPTNGVASSNQAWRAGSPRKRNIMVGRVPRNGFVLDIHDLVVGVEQLDAVAVGIAASRHTWRGRARDGRACALRSCRSRVRAGEIAGVEQMVHLWREEREMMQPRPRAVEEDDVVRIALALQEHAAKIERALGRDVFAEAKARRHVEFAGLPDLGRQDLVVVEAKRRTAGVARELA